MERQVVVRATLCEAALAVGKPGFSSFAKPWEHRWGANSYLMQIGGLCHSAWGLDADRRVNLLILKECPGSKLPAE